MEDRNRYNFDSHVKGVGEQISSQLMDAILKNELKGGDRLTEQELQKLFGVSRSPIREAFRELEKRGLVEIVPRKGTFVKRITREDIEDNFPVRAELERLAAKLAFERMTEKDLEEMDMACLAMKKAAEANDTKTYWKHHLEFHEIFINASGNAVLINTLSTLRMHTLWYQYSYQFFQEDLPRSLSLHERMFKLFKGPKAGEDELLGLMKGHILEACDRFLDYLSREEDKT